MSSSTEAGSDRLAGLLAEHAELETALADPAVHADQSRARRLGRRYAQLAPVVQTARALELTPAEIIQLARNSFEASWLPAQAKAAHAAEIARVASSFQLQ